MAEQQDQALHRRDLGEHEAGADQQEVGRGGAAQAGLGSARQHPGGQEDQGHAEEGGDAERRELQRPAPVEQARVAPARRLPERRQRAPAEEVEEVGPVVRRGADVEGVVRDEGRAARPGQGGDAVEEHRLAQEVEAVGGLAGHGRVPAEVEGELLGERLDRGEVLRLERRAPDEQQHAVPGADQGEVPGGLRRAARRSSASIAVSASFRLSRGGRRSGCGSASSPPGARRRRYAANASTVVVKFSASVLRPPPARGSRRIRSYSASPAAAANRRAASTCSRTSGRSRIRAREAGELAAQQVGDVAVRLDHVHRARAVAQGEQQVRAAAQAQQQHARWAVEQPVGQGGEGRVEVGERAEVAVEARDRASALRRPRRGRAAAPAPAGSSG